MGIEFRTYGGVGSWVVLLHGGPGAAGYMAPVGRELSDSFRVLEPFERRGSEGQPVTVADHVENLQKLIDLQCGSEPPLLVGHSWGAMLALAYAAQFPDTVGGLVLVGSGTFDPESRKVMDQERLDRMSPEMKKRLAELPLKVPDPNKRLALIGKWMKEVDSVDLIKHAPEEVQFDAAGSKQAWADMIELQEEGVYPVSFSIIQCSVIMLHGDQDPHPGMMIYESLKPYIPQLEYHKFTDCGHYPWLEKAAMDEFYKALRQWISRRSV